MAKQNELSSDAYASAYADVSADANASADADADADADGNVDADAMLQPEELAYDSAANDAEIKAYLDGILYQARHHAMGLIETAYETF